MPQYKGTERRNQIQQKRVCTREDSESSGTLSNWGSHGENTEKAAMNSKHSFINIMIRAVRELAAVICIGALVPGSAVAGADTSELPPPADSQAAKTPCRAT